MINKTVCLLFLALFLVMTACTSATDSSLQLTEKHSPTTASDPSKTIFFPRQEKTEGERAVMDGMINGTLVLVDNCIRVDSEEAATSYLLIWPPDFILIIENDMTKILNGDGEIVAHIGDMVQVSGGEINLLSMLDKSIQEQVPPQCTAPYWIIGDEIATMNTPK
ncbi:MAG: hypothetical protein JXA78_19530 [Anaerolineales bacterium]|nr:hypothetical protein [Anaerolineales bacterium]